MTEGAGLKNNSVNDDVDVCYHGNGLSCRESRSGDLSSDYRTLYLKVLQENLALKDELQEKELLLSQNKVELERLQQSQDCSTDRPALLELERFSSFSSFLLTGLLLEQQLLLLLLLLL
ncbi:Protein phosphatase 1 regulatory subunit 12C [Liparis tanakae]|uniref:Protein phosphatase 1 regulatory subunit 12C n=1 Tax=Liparis tanakae TaxID=230148 RepID=A0A4Z2FGG0_9TELE|nr:Protein phosphatase 1 regulatory subunit 12C [Liparis tanakae]